jgi:hypothetical protein
MSGLGLKLIIARAVSLAHAASQIVDVAVASDGSASSVPTEKSFVRGEQVWEAKAAQSAGEVRVTDETVRTQPAQFTGTEASSTSTSFSNPKCKTMNLDAQMVRMAMVAENRGTLPLGATTQEAGLLFPSWQLEAFSINPFLGFAGSYWKETGMTGTEDDFFQDCGWKEMYIGCFKTLNSDQPCFPEDYSLIDDIQSDPSEHLRNYMAVFWNEKGNKYVGEKSCVIAFSGTNDEADVVMQELPDLDVSERIYQGIRGPRTLTTFTPKVSKKKEGVFGGFIAAYDAYEKYANFTTNWLNFANSDKCNSIYMTGHNLGGSISLLHRIDVADYEEQEGYYKATCWGKPCAAIVFGAAAPFYMNPGVEGDDTGLKSLTTGGSTNFGTSSSFCSDPENHPEDCDPVVEAYPKFGATCGATADRHIYLEDDHIPFIWQSRNTYFREAFQNWGLWSHGTNLAQYKIFREIGWSPFKGERIVARMLRHNCENEPWDISAWHNFSANGLYRESELGNDIFVFPSVVDRAEGFGAQGGYGNVTPADTDYLWRYTPAPPNSMAFTLYYWRHVPTAILKAMFDIPFTSLKDVTDTLKTLANAIQR